MELIPLVDLKKQYQLIKTEIDQAMSEVIEKTAFIQGHYVKTFETEFAEMMGVRHCISCANGTDAIYITLKALGIGLGDEVITVANTWISTSEAISQTGATPIFVDCESEFYTIDVTKIESKITSKTKALIPVHLYGQPADLQTIQQLCKKYNLYLIEDCAQAHLAKYKNQYTSTFGIAGTFSFFPGKNLGAYGDAGAIVSNDSDFAQKARRFSQHGALVKHEHEIEGINSRMDGLQAAILCVKLTYLDDWTRKRQAHAQLYTHYLKKTPQVSCPKLREASSHVFHLYVIQAENRDKLAQFLKTKSIVTGRHYPKPLPLLKAYQRFGITAKDIPVANHNKDHILSLPMYPELTKEQIKRISFAISEFYKT